jgi:hypothetical protein
VFRRNFASINPFCLDVKERMCSRYGPMISSGFVLVKSIEKQTWSWYIFDDWLNGRVTFSEFPGIPVNDVFPVHLVAM